MLDLSKLLHGTPLGLGDGWRRLEAELEARTVVGSAGGGLVSVEASGQGVVRRVSIDPSLVDDVEMLEDLLAAAFNDARRKAMAVAEEEMGKLARNLMEQLVRKP
jgi:DNA-binding YbaB/EbfC family protein